MIFLFSVNRNKACLCCNNIKWQVYSHMPSSWFYQKQKPAGSVWWLKITKQPTAVLLLMSDLTTFCQSFCILMLTGRLVGYHWLS